MSNSVIRRIGINASGLVSGLNTVVSGVVLAAYQKGWEVAILQDGYDGMLFPDRYPDGGVRLLDLDMIDRLDAALTGSGRVNPFSVRTVDDGVVEEVDRSEAVLDALRRADVDAVVSVASRQAMSIVHKLARKGLRTVCVPVSAENDVAATQLAFGYNSTLSAAVELLLRIRQSALAEQQIAVVEVLGRDSGWLALQAGIAASADAVLIPEIPYDITRITDELTTARLRRPSLVVVAEGARPVADRQTMDESQESLRRTLSPGSSSEGTVSGRRVIERSGASSQDVVLELQRLCTSRCFSYVLAPMLRSAPTTAVDRQAGAAYGAAAVRGLAEGHADTMVTLRLPHVGFVPLIEAVNAVRTLPPDSDFIHTARSLGISLGA